MTKITLYEAGYLVRVTSYENDGDNTQTVEKHVLTREDAAAYKKIFDLFKHDDVGNIYDDYGSRERKLMESAFKEFAEQNPYMFPDPKVKPFYVIMPLAEEIGLAGISDYFTRSPEKFEAYYFPVDVIVEELDFSKRYMTTLINDEGQHSFGLHILPENSVAYGSIRDVIHAMKDIEEVEVETIFDFVKAQSSIARQSRRAIGNHVYTNDAHDYFKDANLACMIADENAGGTYLFYQNPDDDLKKFDGAFLEIDGAYYIHPEYKKQIRKIIFK